MPINPLRACKEIADSLGENAIVIGDGGDFVATAASVVRVYEQGHWLDPGPLGTLGVGPGYAMAAKLAKPQSRRWSSSTATARSACTRWSSRPCVRQKINVVGVIGNDAGVEADPPRPGADLRRGARGGDGALRSRATRRWSRRSAATASTSSGPRRSARRWSARSAAGKPALVNIKIGSSDFRKDAISI